MMFFWSSCQFAVEVHIVRHALDLGIASIQGATILSFASAVGILSRLAMGRISDSIGRKKAIVISTLVLAGAMLWLIRASELWMLYVFAVFFGFSMGTCAVVNVCECAIDGR